MEDDFNDFSELSAGETSIGLRRCFAQVTAERDQLRAEVERVRGEVDNAEGKESYAWNHRHAELLDATARAEAAEATVAGLRRAAQAVVNRWDSPKWKDQEPTAVVMNELRTALAARGTR